MKKTYLVDASVFLQAPQAFFAFEDNDIVILDSCINKLVEAARSGGETRDNAQESIRTLDRLLADGYDKAGIPLGEGRGQLFIEQTDGFAGNISKLWNVKENISQRTGFAPILVAQDPALRAMVSFHGIMKAEPYRSDAVSAGAMYSGRKDVNVADEIIDLLYENKVVLVEDLQAEGIEPNMYLTLHGLGSHTALARCDGSGRYVELLRVPDVVCNVKPKNAGQRFALDALLRPASECPLVILKGAAGTAKTFLALAAALEQTIGKSNEEEMYRRILVVRPNIKFDKTIGYLKGSEEEKVGPLIRPIMDNLEQLTAIHPSTSPYSSKRGGKRGKRGFDDDDDKFIAPNSYVQELFDSGIVTAQAMEYMRGRSICDTYIIIDEAQNMTPSQAFGIVSRAGRGTKIVIEGDPYQIDDPHLDTTTNGLVWAAQKMRGSALCAQLSFEESECERSDLAAEAIHRMAPKGV